MNINLQKIANMVFKEFLVFQNFWFARVYNPIVFQSIKYTIPLTINNYNFVI